MEGYYTTKVKIITLLLWVNLNFLVYNYIQIPKNIIFIYREGYLY